MDKDFSEKIEDYLIKVLGEKIYYPLWRVFDYIKYIPKEIKWFFQRGFRGYDDRCYWDVNDYLGKEIVRHLKNFKEMKRSGVPGNLCFDDDGKEISVEEGEKRWNEILDKMISGFEGLMVDPIDREPWKLYYEKKEISKDEWQKREKEEYEENKKNAMLFVEHFYGLWD